MTEEEEGGRRVEAWIIDVHTHILPPRLATKIRNFFDAQILIDGGKSKIKSDAGNESKAVEESPSSTSCCGGGAAYKDQEDWTEADFSQHGKFHFPYHPYDPLELVKEQNKNAIHTIWVLPYAHKSKMAIELNKSIVDICSNLTNSSNSNNNRSNTDTKGKECEEDKNRLHQAIVAFTVHPDDGVEGVRQTTLQAIRTGNARAAKLHCSVGNYSITHPNLAPFWQLANRVLFPVIVHFGSSISGHTATEELRQVEELLRTYSSVPLIIAHSGHPAVQRAIKLAIQFENVYLDTTPVVTKFPAYPPTKHALHEPLMQLATSGRVLFGSDMPNVVIKLEDQIQSVFHTFADQQWSEPKTLNWWTSRAEARRAGKAVEQVLFGAANSLLARVDVSKAEWIDGSSKM